MIRIDVGITVIEEAEKHDGIRAQRNFETWQAASQWLELLIGAAFNATDEKSKKIDISH